MNISWQDYISVIFEYMEMDVKVSNKLICKKLNISPPSVSAMIKKLKDSELVDTKGYEVYLTDEGKKEAKKILSKHRLWEYFLEKELGYDWADVHEEAKSLQYMTSDNLMKKLNEYLGKPKSCPHGGDIFVNNYSDIKSIPLSNFEIGKKVVINRFSDNKELLDYVNRKNISIGNEIIIVDIDNFDNTIVVESNGNKIEIGLKAAKNIFVSEK